MSKYQNITLRGGAQNDILQINLRSDSIKQTALRVKNIVGVVNRGIVEDVLQWRIDSGVARSVVALALFTVIIAYKI